MESPLIGGGRSGLSGSDEEVLHHAPSGVLVPEDEMGDYPVVRTMSDGKYIFWVESTRLWAIAGPIAFTILCNYGINSFTNIFVGHIGDIELSAVAISLSVIANFSFGFMLGMGSALETLCGQAFGAGQINMLGVYMQRSWIILFIACFFLLPLYIFATPILKLLGQEDDIAQLAGTFAIQCIPQLFSLAVNFPCQKFLQAQSKVGIMAWIGFVALVVHILMLYFLIEVFGWGTAGAAAAYNISAWGIGVAQVVYIVGWCKDAWTGLSWLAFQDLWPFVKLSVASAVMLCLEIWYFMTIIVLTGHLANPVIAVGSLSICESTKLSLELEEKLAKNDDDDNDGGRHSRTFRSSNGDTGGGDGWQCRRIRSDEHSLRGQNQASLVPLPSAKSVANTIAAAPRKRGRPRKYPEVPPPPPPHVPMEQPIVFPSYSTNQINPLYEFYNYYPGLGPHWGKQIRGDGSNNEGAAEPLSNNGGRINSDSGGGQDGFGKRSSRSDKFASWICNVSDKDDEFEELNYIDDENDEEAEDDGGGGDNGGRRRGRKPVKARSLKSLM
ncbi:DETOXIFICATION 34-like protein [Drosera capensis]